ncbi:DUF4231 domain-containing protein [Rhizobium sp. PP-CC-3G-465]|uniref:DUF4231 domain-containing protein n=1 Tax=Rhizobium sp. PP-CC-3G-465 TaxID=2135648 RepID=UPI00105072FF|nr:uncharacterized protein DUF4231 [Rhizobium sp. PP-CC-3G-465]
MDDKNLLDTWKARETKLLGYVNGAMEYYAETTRWCRYAQRGLSITVMVCAALAPVAVVSSSGNGLGALGLHEPEIKILALIITILLAIADGLRRIFRYDQRWATCYIARETLKRARENYRITVIGLEVGSDDWKKNYEDLRATYESVIDRETQEFFDTVRTDYTTTLPKKI